jgi:HK97 family phage portal protein
MNTTGYSVITCDASLPSVELQPIAFRPARERSFNIEDPSYPLDDPSVYTEGEQSLAGERVTPCRILHVPAAYQAVTRISGDVARCPLEPWEQVDGVWKLLADDPLYRLTAIQPNREMDAFTFWQRVMVHRLVYQNAYIFIATNLAGEPAELLPLLPDRTAPKRIGGVLLYETDVNGQRVPLPANRVLHLQGIGFDNLKAYELVKAMREAWGLALASMGFAARVFRSGGRRGGVLEIPLSMTKPAADRLEEGFRRKYEDPSAAFATVILRDNAKFHESQMTLRDSQSIEGRKESVRDVARAFNMRPGMLGEGNDGVYKNRFEDAQDYLNYTLRQPMAGIADQCRTKLLTVDRQARTVFEHNTDDLLQMSPKEQFEAYGAGVETTIITPNEARAKLGFAPHPGGNELRNPNTVSNKPGGQPAKPGTSKPGKSKPDDTAGGDDEDDGDDLEAAHGRLQAEHAALVARNVADVVAVIGEQAGRAAGSGAKFCSWLDAKLPEKRANFERAGLAPDAAELEINTLAEDLNAIADSTTAADLKAAVATYFETRSQKP